VVSVVLNAKGRGIVTFCISMRGAISTFLEEEPVEDCWSALDSFLPEETGLSLRCARARSAAKWA
jgi:hypothetical protein